MPDNVVAKNFIARNMTYRCLGPGNWRSRFTRVTTTSRDLLIRFSPQACTPIHGDFLAQSGELFMWERNAQRRQFLFSTRLDVSGTMSAVTFLRESR